MAHRNIPIFIPHLGCPNLCVFCNQRSISGRSGFSPDNVREEIDRSLATDADPEDTEIAFFGGSFTGIDRRLMIELLEIAESYVRAGRVRSIRLSTRPDYIDLEILGILSRYSVRVIELGLQSMNNAVLKASQRGHTSECAEAACRMVRESGFSLVGQMMIGLPASTLEDELGTARKIAELGADAVRIYPTVVFYDTPLCQMTETGDYTPLALADAVERSAAVLRVFLERGIPCIRLGLCSSEALTSPETVMAGPNHPALGELVWSELWYDTLKERIRDAGLLGHRIILNLPAREISRIVGHRRCNLERLERETGTRVCRVIGQQNSNEILPMQAGDDK